MAGVQAPARQASDPDLIDQTVQARARFCQAAGGLCALPGFIGDALDSSRELMNAAIDFSERYGLTYYGAVRSGRSMRTRNPPAGLSCNCN
ncbi:hypothetical protein KUIN1_31650 [Pseudomonas sp. KUIN-1]|nr:hypothetical protein KUIN1_31650 [Pseudomonas sp. KUIN-1]